jgi:hypothetical protein
MSLRISSILFRKNKLCSLANIAADTLVESISSNPRVLKNTSRSGTRLDLLIPLNSFFSLSSNKVVTTSKPPHFLALRFRVG